MRIFLSYSRKDEGLALRVISALNSAGFKTFLDSKNLPIGKEFNTRIIDAIGQADLFIFLVSQHSIRPGSFALTELSFAEEKWINPSGYVLPVFIEDLGNNKLPAYIMPITALTVKGNLEAEIVAWVNKRVSDGGGVSATITPTERLKLWARSAHPPLKKPVKRIPQSYILRFVFGIICIIGGFKFYNGWNTTDHEGSFLGSIVLFDLPFLLAIPIGIGFLIYAVIKAVKLLNENLNATAAIILGRELKGQDIIIYVELINGDRLKLEPVSLGAKNAFIGDLGWVYIAEELLVDFQPSQPESLFS